ncbi:phage tail tape measure protein [[Ruminococcus] lactaris]|uniref:Phage tail tape measure protein n=1 Tax=[Ruminococcus] lactaris TaxID=46228 RepID=A0A414P9F7_9FIRM|nr:phage tail tape measure protein [[Ruminococcus] lactaris]RHF62913.1 phage tail tape measure protein [[Ruminococcus] lactaris]
MTGGIKLAPLMTEIKVNIDGFKNDMQKAATAGVKEADRISEKLSSVTKAGEKLSKIGTAMMAGLTVPLISAGTAATKMAVDYESSFAKVSTLLDANVVNYQEYKNQLLDASSESKIAIDEFSEAVYSSISAGVDQTKAISFTTDAMKLAKGGFTDGAKAVDVLTTAINGYNLKSSDATRISDLLITTQNLGKTTVDELASSMGTVIPVASSVNFNVNELSASYAQLTKNGIATAESGTYLKAMLSELGKSGSITDGTLRELTGKGFAQLKAEGVSTTKILQMISDEAGKNGKTLKDMFSSVEAGSAALVLAKGSGAEYNEMLQGMRSSAGATQEAFDKMDATPAEQLNGAINKLKNDAIKFGAAFVPVVTKVSDKLGEVADRFSNLSDEEKENAIKWGLVLAATGPVIKVVGGGITTFTKLASVIGGASKAVGSTGLTGSMTGLLGIAVPVAVGVAAVGTALYVMHENAQLASRKCTDASEDMSLMEKVLAKLKGTETHTKEEMVELGYVYEDFGENISPEFQEAVEESAKKVQDFNVYLREIGFDNVISQAESAEFNRRVNETCDEAIKTIQGKKEEAQLGLKELFIADDQVIDESEQKVLDALAKSSDKQIAEVTTLEGEILAIKQKAVDEKRALNDQEIADIESKNARIRQIELEAVGGTEEELLYAKNEFNARAKNLDAESASELLQEKVKARNDEIVKIKASYDTEIELLKSKLDEMNAEDRKAAEEQINNLEKDKQDKINKQEELYEEYLAIIRENNPNLMDELNKFSGEVLSNADKECKERLDLYRETYGDLSQIQETGLYTIYNKESHTWNQVAAVVDEGTGEITAMYSNMVGASAGWSESMAKDAEKMIKKADDASDVIAQLVDANDYYVDSAGNVVQAATGIASEMEQVTKKTDGSREGIVKINNTPYKIQVNKDGTIRSLSEIKEAADNAAKPRTLTIKAELAAGINAKAMFERQQASYNFNGIDNVPYDGYHAILHKNERVLTAEENKTYSNQQPVDYGTIQSIIRREVSNIVIELNGREFARAVRQV